MLSLVDKFVKQVDPQFNHDDTIIGTYSSSDNEFLEYYSPDKNGKTFALYYVWTHQLVLNRELFHKLEDYFGEEKMSFILDWFNKEFDQEAESVNF